MMLEHPNERTRHTHSCVIKRKTSFKFKQVILLIFFEIFNTILDQSINYLYMMNGKYRLL